MRVIKLTQATLDEWNKAPPNRRRGIFTILASGYLVGLVAPRPLWRDDRIAVESAGADQGTPTGPDPP